MGIIEYATATGDVWPRRLTVRTPAFQAGNAGSIPAGATSF